jgi:hypothetical protein
MDNYYVYLHIKADTGEPFYVGKGKGDRHTKKNRSSFWKNIVNKHGYDILILEYNLCEQKAFELEVYWIKRIGRRDLGLGPLVNLTDGGEGASGKKLTIEHKNKIREKIIGIKRSDEYKKKLSKIMSGDKNPMKLKKNRDIVSRKLKGFVNYCHEIEYKGVKYKSIKEIYNLHFKNQFSCYKSFHRKYKIYGFSNELILQTFKGNNKSVVNINNNQIYKSAKEVFENNNFNFSLSHFRSMLNGSKINTTHYKYV